MRQKIAIPSYNNRISPLFDVSRRFIIFNAKDRVLDESYYIDTSSDSGLDKIDKLKNELVNVIICSAISKAFAEYITVKGMDLIPGIIGDIDDVIRAYLNNNLIIELYSMPGCRGRWRARRGQCPRYRDIMKQ
jgi:predicted Fe-Mo cluster-binding NifX family protein